MKLINFLVVGLLLITSCSKSENGTYKEPEEPVRRLQLLEAPPITAERKVNVSEMVNGGAGTFVLTDHQVHIAGIGKASWNDVLGNYKEREVWGSLLVPYNFQHQSKIISSTNFVNITKGSDSFTNNNFIYLTELVNVPLAIRRSDGLYKNIVHSEFHFDGDLEVLTNHPTFVEEKDGSFMVNKIYNDPNLVSLSNDFYKVNDTTYQKRLTLVRYQNDATNGVYRTVKLETVHISTYRLINQDLGAPTDLILAAEVGQFFVDNKRFKIDYDEYNQAVVYFSTHYKGAELFETFKEAMLFAFNEGGLELEAVDAFLFAEKVIEQDDHALFLTDYISSFNEGLNVFGMTTQEAKTFADKQLSL